LPATNTLAYFVDESFAIEKSFCRIGWHLEVIGSIDPNDDCGFGDGAGLLCFGLGVGELIPARRLGSNPRSFGSRPCRNLGSSPARRLRSIP
jgi:hypothetical protein